MNVTGCTCWFLTGIGGKAIAREDPFISINYSLDHTAAYPELAPHLQLYLLLDMPFANSHGRMSVYIYYLLQLSSTNTSVQMHAHIKQPAQDHVDM